GSPPGNSPANRNFPIHRSSCALERSCVTFAFSHACETMLVASSPETNLLLRKLPRAEIHLHLEGTLLPHRIMSLAQKYSVPVDWNEIHSRYSTRNFTQFLELYKWATSFLRE